MTSMYRKVHEITEEEFLAALTHRPKHQLALFIELGGDPDDHNYARISFLTKRLREKGHKIGSSPAGLWLEGA